MKNHKFGAFVAALVLGVGALVTSVGAQTRTPNEFEPGRRLDRPGDRRVFVLDGRGSQLGVMVSDVDSRGPSSGQTAGVRIDEVNPDSPAEKAGIKAGDIIVEFDGERVRSARQFTRLVQETPEGRTVSIALMRDGKRETVSATPENGRETWNIGPDVDRAMREAERGMRGFRFDMPEFNFRYDDRDRFRDREPRRFEYRMPPDIMPFMNRSRGRLGVTVQPMTRELEEYFGAKNGGALVSSVTPDSSASRAGIRAGDVIVSINGKSVRDSDDLIEELEDVDGEATIVVLRDKKEMTLKATIERPQARVPRAGSRPGAVL